MCLRIIRRRFVSEHKKKTWKYLCLRKFVQFEWFCSVGWCGDFISSLSFHYATVYIVFTNLNEKNLDIITMVLWVYGCELRVKERKEMLYIMICYCFCVERTVNGNWKYDLEVQSYYWLGENAAIFIFCHFNIKLIRLIENLWALRILKSWLRYNIHECGIFGKHNRQ